MTRFFMILFILCLLATAGAWYWKTSHPAGEEIAMSAPGASADGESGSSLESAQPSARSSGSELKQAIRKASRTQDLASMVSLVCSVLSGLGAVFSAYFSYLRYRHQKRLAART